MYLSVLMRLDHLWKKAFQQVGVPLEDAKVCADVLIESDLRGIESHGINRFKGFYIDRILKGIQEPVTQIEIVRDTPTTAVIDGHNGMGMVIAKKAMHMAITKAKQLGLGMVVVRNSTHYGIAGYLCIYGHQRKPDRYYWNERQTINCTDIWCI